MIVMEWEGNQQGSEVLTSLSLCVVDAAKISICFIFQWQIRRSSKWSETVAEEIQRARLLKELEADFVPDYDATTMPSADKRAAYVLEHIAFRMSRVDKKLDEFMAMLAKALIKA
jgi:hypothetical protein